MLPARPRRPRVRRRDRCTRYRVPFGPTRYAASSRPSTELLQRMTRADVHASVITRGGTGRTTTGDAVRCIASSALLQGPRLAGLRFVVAEECERLAYRAVKFGRPVDVSDGIVAQPLLAFGVIYRGSPDVIGKASGGCVLNALAHGPEHVLVAEQVRRRRTFLPWPSHPTQRMPRLYKRRSALALRTNRGRRTPTGGPLRLQVSQSRMSDKSGRKIDISSRI